MANDMEFTSPEPPVDFTIGKVQRTRVVDFHQLNITFASGQVLLVFGADLSRNFKDHA